MRLQLGARVCVCDGAVCSYFCGFLFFYDFGVTVVARSAFVMLLAAIFLEGTLRLWRELLVSRLSCSPAEVQRRCAVGAGKEGAKVRGRQGGMPVGSPKPSVQ